MARIEKRGAGLKAYDVKVFDIRNKSDQEGMIEALRGMTSPAIARRENAESFRYLLEAAGHPFDDPETVKLAPYWPEDSAEYITFHWLLEYERHQQAIEWVRAGEVGKVDLVSRSGEAMGKLMERFWWRCVKDKMTGQRPEEMALSRKKSLVPLMHQNEGAREANAARHHDKTIRVPLLQDIANEYWIRKPQASKVEVANFVSREFPRRHPDLMPLKAGTIRNNIKKPE